MKVTKKSGKSCEKCGSQNLKACRTTYPLQMGEKQINVGRVSVQQCLDCDALMPTKAGLEKIERCSMMTLMLFLENA